MIPKVKTWRVRIIDETGAIVSEEIVDAPNKRFAIWNSSFRMPLDLGLRFTVSPGPGTTLAFRDGTGDVTTIEIAN